MKINSLILFLGFPILGVAQGQSQQGPPALRINSVSGINITMANTGDITSEAPPLVKPGGIRSYYLSNNFSRLYPFDFNLAADGITSMWFPGYNSTVTSTPLTWWGGYRYPSTNAEWQWKRNYNGITSQHSVNIPSRGNVVIAMVHGENKNEKITSGGTTYYFQNSVLPEQQLIPHLESTYSGMKSNGKYSDFFGAYFGFVGACFTDNTQNNSWGNAYHNELGPVVWPSNGYVTPQRTQASCGVRHPSSIVANGYIYTYYQDTRTAPDAPEGRKQGIKVIRVEVENSLNPNAYKVYYNGSWIPSLPSGFTVANMMNYLTVQGPPSTVIDHDGLGDGDIVSFKVAKVRNTDWFLALEGGFYNGIGKFYFRLSKDLVNWSPRLYTVIDATGTSFEYGGATFLDQYGLTNYEIDLHKFYVIGLSGEPTNGQPSINRMCINMDIYYQSIGIGGDAPLAGDSNPGGIEAIKEDIQVIMEDKIVHIFSPQEKSNKKYSLYTMYGQLMKEETSSGDDLFDMNLSDLSTTGVYILRVDSQDKHFTKKIFVD